MNPIWRVKLKHASNRIGDSAVAVDAAALPTSLTRISVVVPTLCRPEALHRCLMGLAAQQRTADEIIVVVLPGDAMTTRVVKQVRGLPNLTIATVARTGQIAACNVGLTTATGDIIAITDDDAVPRSDWLALIEKHFRSDSKIGAVGGRDWVHGSPSVPASPRLVGKVQWFGRTIGNHHLGEGRPRAVEFLKGVNMSFRRAAVDPVRFDERLRGDGAQVHNDLALSLAIKRLGWKVIYDPAVAVDHFPAPRNGLQRSQFDPKSVADAVYNETLSLLEYLPGTRRGVFLLWALLIGSRPAYGLCQCIRFLPREGRLSVHKLLASLRGRWEGVQAFRG